MNNREYFNKFLLHDAESPSGLRWKVDRLRGRGPSYLVRAGDAAGWLAVSKSGREVYQISVESSKYLNHRIIYLLSVGEIPHGMIIDHINGDSTDNRLENLRCTTYKVNGRNSCMRVDNTSGVTGVFFQDVKGRRNPFYLASWTDANGKRRGKAFPTIEVGKEAAFEAACKFRADKIDELALAGEGYSDRHGLRREYADKIKQL